MTRIGLLSDTHGLLDKRILEHFKDVDEIWHAGDIGSAEVLQALRSSSPRVRYMATWTRAMCAIR